MGLAMEVISGTVTNPSTTVTPLTPSNGDQFTVRAFNQGDTAWMLDQWALGATKGLIRTTSPRIHDNVAGITLAYAAALPVPLWSAYAREKLYPQDNLGIALSGGASEVDVATSLMYYSNLPGTSARLYTPAEVASRALHQSGVQLALTTGGTAGQYGGATAINATQNQFKANTDYAILGYVTDTAVATVGIRSADFGNLRVGGPGTNNKIETRDWFTRLSDTYGLPMVPVFNAANVSNTIVDVMTTQTSTGIVITFECLELSTPGGQTS